MALVDDLRRLASAGTAEYSAAGSTFWTDAQLAQALADNRWLNHEAELYWFGDRNTGGSLTYLRAKLDVPGRLNYGSAGSAGTAQGGTVLAGGTIRNAGGTLIGSWLVDADGWVTFGTDTRGSAYRFTGYSYDLYAAAVDVLEAWASALKLQAFDFETDAQKFTRSQKVTHLRDLADDYRAKAVPTSVAMVTGDERRC